MLDGASPSRTTASRPSSEPPSPRRGTSPSATRTINENDITMSPIDTFGAADRPQSSPMRRPSRSRSAESYRSRQRDSEWRVDARLRIPRHDASCLRCDDYVEHVRLADHGENESLERGFDDIRNLYNAPQRDEITRLKARLEESRDARERDVARLEKQVRDGQRWRMERDVARDRVKELEREIEQLRAAARTVTAAPLGASSFPGISPTPVVRAHAPTAPVAGGVTSHEPRYGSGRQSFAERLGAPGPPQPRPRTPAPEPGPSRPLAPRPAPAGDEALAMRLFELDNTPMDDEWFAEAEFEKETEAEEAAERAERTGKGRAVAGQKAPMAHTKTPGPGKRKAAPTSPDGVRPAPAGPQTSYRPRGPPPRPEGNEEWLLVRNTHWLRRDNSAEVQAWINTPDTEILSIFSNSRRTELGAITRLQRLIMSAPMPPERVNRSYVQNAVNRAVLDWGNQSNHPATRDAGRSGGVLQGANLAYNPVDMTAQLFFNQLSRINSPRGRSDRHGVAVTRIARGIFARRNRYDILVEELDPDATDPPPTATRLDQSSSFDFSSFQSPEQISERDVAAYLWRTLRVPRSIASTVFVPYARRLARVSIATELLRTRLAEDAALPAEERRWNGVTERMAAQSFRPRSALSFPVRTVSLFSSGPIVHWLLPVGEFAASTEEVDANLEWLPEAVREEFRAEYMERTSQSGDE